jgi:hypothetical protein
MSKVKGWLTQEELHIKWGVSVNTIKQWRKEGLTSYQVGKSVRFIEEDVIGFVMTKKIIEKYIDDKCNLNKRAAECNRAIKPKQNPVPEDNKQSPPDSNVGSNDSK